ncbi:MAG: hypothetical protein AB7G21_12950 [Dehalococcoidia bacterium]
MVASLAVDVVLLAALIGLWVFILRTARRLAAADPAGTAPRPRRPMKGLTLAGMVLWFVSANIADPSTRAGVFYLGWVLVFGDAAWYLWALRRLDRPEARNLD